MEATSSEVSTPMPPVIALRDLKDHKTVNIRTNQLQVGDMVLAWGAHFRKVLSISTHVAISEYQLYGESDAHRHSWLVEQTILDRAHTPDPRDAEIAALVAENEALHEKLSRKDEACNTTINAALMLPDPVRERLVSRAAVDDGVPQGFIDYVQANYNGVVDIHRPEWHAKRLWNAAMRHVSPTVVGAGARDVLAERQRQVDVKDWTPEHDDHHPSGEIAAFAAVYAMPPAARSWPASETGYGPTFGTALCPQDWQPKFGDRRRELVKAGALILAEIERIDRAAANGVAGVTP